MPLVPGVHPTERFLGRLIQCPVPVVVPREVIGR